MNRRVLAIVFGHCVWLLLSCSLSSGSQADINCLKSIKASLQDPNGVLTSSWNFDNNTEGFICRFIGVDCWHQDENKVLNIKLSDMGLKGEFPRGIKECASLTGLDLSSNNLSGTIPSDISKLIGFVTTLDLSVNQFSGEIPVNLANCSYLNVLKLDNNLLSGPIPAEIGSLGRLKKFTVTNNRLTGPVPNFYNSSIGADSYTNNKGLCGKPLDTCRNSKNPPTRTIIKAAVGGVTVAALVVGIGLFFYYRRLSKLMKKRKNDDPDGNKWAKSLKGTKGIKVSMFKKSVSKMRFSDLMNATNNFNKENIIATGRTGTMYKGVLEDGTLLMVKRLQDSLHSEKEFASEMATLGNVQNRNLVPLLGFCIASKERLLVYNNMPNGSLYDNLHPCDDGKTIKLMEWPLRLKISIGAARGFAWLHHSCNPRILHRNISSRCILLDADFEPKISDFGLARLMNPIDTHMSTFVNGEFGDLGYGAPEYARTLMATPKGDVYSFGVLLLELVTGQEPNKVTNAPESFKGNLVDWVLQSSNNSQLREVIDKSLVGKRANDDIFRVLKVACNCVISTPKERPTMFEVYQFLRAIGEPYNFTTEDEILVPVDNGDADYLRELIVAQDINIQ